MPLPPIKSFNYDTRYPESVMAYSDTKMDNLILVDGDGIEVKYCVNFSGFGQSREFLSFDVTCVDSNGIQRGQNNVVSVNTNLHYVDELELAQRFLLDVLKDAAAGGVSKQEMKKLLKELGFNVDIINGVNIDGLIEKLKGFTKINITEHSKPAYHERSVDGLYKLALFTARLLFLETGSLSKFSSYKVFEKGIWRACNAFHAAGGRWNGMESLITIIANGFALQFQTPATTQDPASPCQSPYGQSMRCIQGQDWFNAMYGLMLAKLSGFEISIELLYDWCSETEIATLLRHEATDDGNGDSEVQMGGTKLAAGSKPSGHFVSSDAAKVTLNISYKYPGMKETRIMPATGAVYHSVPKKCTNKPWSETSRQRLGKGFTPFLLGNTQNGYVFNASISEINRKCTLNPTECIKDLQHIFGKEDGDCSQIHAILYYVIQLAVHWSRNSKTQFDDCFNNLMKEVMVVTCDRVVYYTCMCLKIPCTYTGSGDGKVHVYEPYKGELSKADQEKRDIELARIKLTSEFENSMKFLNSQNNLLSKVMFCGISSVRYDRDGRSVVVPFPNNCYTQIKDIVGVKKDRLIFVTYCVKKIKEAATLQISLEELLVSFVMAIIITNLAVNTTNIKEVLNIVDTYFSGIDFKKMFLAMEATPFWSSWIDTLDSPVSQKYYLRSPPDMTYFDDIAKKITPFIESLSTYPDDAMNYFKFLTTLNDFILKDVNNKCVSTTQEKSIYADGNLTLYILNNVFIPQSFITQWATEAQSVQGRPTRSNGNGANGANGGQGGGRRRKKIIQTGGTVNIIKEALEVNLNDRTAKHSFVKKHKDKDKRIVERVIQTQINPRVLRYYLTSLSKYRENRIRELNTEIARIRPAEDSMSPETNALHKKIPVITLSEEQQKQLTVLEFEKEDHEARLSKENFMNQMLENDTTTTTTEQDKEYYWKTRNKCFDIIKSGEELKLTIIEKTVLEMSDIEMLVCMYASIKTAKPPLLNSTIDYVKFVYKEFYKLQPPPPLMFLPIPLSVRLNYLYTYYRQQYQSPNNEYATEIRKYLLYGEVKGLPNILDITRIKILFVLHIFLNELIMDMIPDSYGRNLDLSNDQQLLYLLQQTYTISSSVIPSTHTQEQIDEAAAAASSKSVSQSRPQPTQVSDNDLNTDGGSSTRTRRKLARNHRRTQYTNKHKRSSKTTKHSTIKHRKSYRKHNRTIKRRKSRRHH